jgi:hypothetical protein
MKQKIQTRLTACSNPYTVSDRRFISKTFKALPDEASKEPKWRDLAIAVSIVVMAAVDALAYLVQVI